MQVRPAIVCAGIVLLACQTRFSIGVEGANASAPVFVPSRGGKVGVRINTFGVYVKKGDSWSPKDAVWEFKQEPGSYSGLTRITYGETPNGFRQSKEPGELAVGEVYVAAAYADIGHGITSFTILADGDRTVLKVVEE
jgi:hypothetical protein